MTPFNIPYTLPSFVAKKNSPQLNVTVLLFDLSWFDIFETLYLKDFQKYQPILQNWQLGHPRFVLSLSGISFSP